MHEQFLLAALEQARLGQGSCAPNPCVGAVAVHNGTIIAHAFHNGAGTPHAEQLLLAQLPPKIPGISVYITLEPCNHWGKTPPCVQALVDYGVEQVVFAYYDPNPLVAVNNSSEQLRQQGISVTHYPLKEIDDFYTSYTHWVETGKPRVTVKMAQSFDGKIGRADGDRLILSNGLCAEFTHKQRAIYDVILTSAKTIHCDNPKMNVRLNGHEQAKIVAIIDKNLSLDQNALIFSTASHCLIYHRTGVTVPQDQIAGRSSASIEKKDQVPRCTYYAMPIKNNQLDLAAVISHLGELGYHDVWVEAGGAVFSALHKQRLVDRTYLYLVPTSLGENAVSAYQQNGIFDRKHRVSWHVMGDNMIACLDWSED